MVRISKLLPPKRFRKAWYLSTIASITAIALSIGPNFRGTYDSALAVLTLTLITIIWYTYFTYQSVHRSPTIIRIESEATNIDADSVTLQLTIRNHSPRSVSVSPILELWLDSNPIDQSSFNAMHKETVINSKGRWFYSIVIPDDEMQSKQNSFGEPEPTKEVLLFKFSLLWEDDLGDEGVIKPRYWRGDIASKEWIPLYRPKEIRDLFSHLNQLQ